MTCNLNNMASDRFLIVILNDENKRHFYGIDKIIFKNEEKELVFTGKEFIDYAEICLKSKEDKKNEGEPYITLMEFYAQTQICHPSSISRLLESDSQFMYLCGKKTTKKYLIRKEAAIEFLTTCYSARIRNAVKKYLHERKQKETLCQSNLPLR
jgi:hypothetical protein